MGFLEEEGDAIDGLGGLKRLQKHSSIVDVGSEVDRILNILPVQKHLLGLLLQSAKCGRCRSHLCSCSKVHARTTQLK